MTIIYCLIAIIATAGWAKLFYYAIQPGEIFSFYWRWLQSMDEKGWHIVKPLGMCEMCYSIFCGFISYWCASIVILYGQKWYWWVLLYFVYVPTSALINIYVLKKFLK